MEFQENRSKKTYIKLMKHGLIHSVATQSNGSS